MTEDKLTFRDALLYPKAMIVKNATKYINIIAFIVHHPISDEMQYEITNCKVILRSIEQLTDEEKQYIAKNFLLVDWGVLEGRTNQITLIHIMSWCEFEKLKDLLDYFREIGVDIDGMFKSGKAAKDDK